MPRSITVFIDEGVNTEMNRNIAATVRLVLAALLLPIWFACPAKGDEQKFVVTLSGEKRLDMYSIDGQGELTLHSQTTMVSTPGTSRFDHAGNNLYVGTSKPSQISVCRVKLDGFTELQSVDVPAKPSYLTVSPDGNFLLAAYYSTGQVTVHRILGDGQLSGEPIQTITTAPNAHCVSTDRSGNFVFVPHTTPNAIYQFRMDPKTGRLTANDPPLLQRESNMGPRHIVFHADTKFAYCSNEQGRSISQYSLDSESGLLTHVQTLPSVPEDFAEKANTSDIHIHPSGRFAYISNRGHGTVAVFAIDVATGKLKLLQHVPSSESVRSFCLSTDGRFLIAACQRTGMLITYTIATDGRLKQIDTQHVGKGPWWVTLPPATSESNDTIADTINRPADRTLTLGQGTMSGEVTSSTILLQTRLTLGTELDSSGDLPGSGGVARFEWSTQENFGDAQRTPFKDALAKSDFIVREQLTHLKPDTKYFYRVIFGSSITETSIGPTCSFRTLPGADGSRTVKFIVASCMNYNKFMHGREGSAGGPITATEEDKRLGFPAFEVMRKIQPDFFVGTGDIVYYDNKFRVSETTEELRRCWHEQFRFPRMIEFFRNVPAYWSKDDHDFRYNDSDNETNRLPLPDAGINLFHEQVPIAAAGAEDPKSYRTIRVSRDLQIWLTEGRDYRAPNDAPDGPQKSMWGKTQREWLMTTLAASDARWKLIISPTPMVGPDMSKKKDNHASLRGFRHEADEFFEWVNKQGIDNLFLICGDRHWQYHSIHPSGINEFACGALNDENSRMGVPPGAKSGTDPDGNIQQPFSSPEPSGGFIEIEAGNSLSVSIYDDEAKKLYAVEFPQQTEK